MIKFIFPRGITLLLLLGLSYSAYSMDDTQDTKEAVEELYVHYITDEPCKVYNNSYELPENNILYWHGNDWKRGDEISKNNYPLNLYSRNYTDKIDMMSRVSLSSYKKILHKFPYLNSSEKEFGKPLALRVHAWLADAVRTKGENAGKKIQRPWNSLRK